MAQTHQHQSSSDKEFTLLDNAVINLIVEKTKLNKEKYSLILSKTVIVYVLFIALAMYSSVTDFVSKQVVIVGLVVGTLLLAVVYFYVIDHFGKMDRDIDEVVSLLQTKAFLSKKK
jgi:presenilin-like A22 family membrane protease